jgi:hypothetical protein
MNIASALSTAIAEAGWSKTKLATEAGDVSTDAARSWLLGESVPNGTSLALLERKLPRFRELLDAEFDRIYGTRAA